MLGSAWEQTTVFVGPIFAKWCPVQFAIVDLASKIKESHIDLTENSFNFQSFPGILLKFRSFDALNSHFRPLFLW